MIWIRQTLAVTWQSLINLPQRTASSLVAVTGVAGVVLVFVAVLSMAYGFQKTLAGGGSDSNMIVLRSGASSEMDSGLSGDQTRIIKDVPSVEFAAGELFVLATLPRRSNGSDSNVPVRGVEPASRDIRGTIELVEGRWFEEGKQELVVGVGAHSQFDVDVGSSIRLGQQDWAVTGRFSADGGLAESELWADARVLQGAYRRGNNFSVVQVRLDDPASAQSFKDQLTEDPRLSLKIASEQEFYSEQSQILSTLIRVVGYGVAILMALGAVFGALNTMYTAVSDRAREIGTLRALGFSSSSIVVSVMVEALILALAGGLIGGAAAYLVFNGFTVSTLNYASFSQVVFGFAVTPQLLTQGIVMALVIGFIGGLMPALRAARMPVSMALRQG